MFKDYLASSKQNIEQWLGEVLNSPNQEFEQLYESMNYSLMQGGKRIRPILTKAVLEMLHKEPADYKEFPSIWILPAPLNVYIPIRSFMMIFPVWIMMIIAEVI